MRRIVGVIVLTVALVAILGFAVRRAVLAVSYTQLSRGTCIAWDVDLKPPAPFSKLELEGTVVGLAASGGGSRAAYLTAAILREIRRSGLSLRAGDPTTLVQSLLDQIDLVSGVSGGSLAAAYFVAHAEKLKTVDANDLAWRDFLDAMAIGHRRNQYRKALTSPKLWG
jgi:predicted acylesterase/phospholipase RssA